MCYSFLYFVNTVCNGFEANGSTEQIIVLMNVMSQLKGVGCKKYVVTM